MPSTTTKRPDFKCQPPFSPQIYLNFSPRTLEPAVLTAYLHTVAVRSSTLPCQNSFVNAVKVKKG